MLHRSRLAVVSVMLGLSGCRSPGAEPATDSGVPPAEDLVMGIKDAAMGGVDGSVGFDGGGVDGSVGFDGGGGDGSVGFDGGAPKIPICTQSCLAPEDCSQGASAAFDADNYNCTAGACEYKGCNSNAECQSTFSSSAYICRAISGSVVPVCVLSCLMPQDCSMLGASVAFDADNYNCTAGACEYKGCNSDAECQSTFSSSAYICRAISGSVVPVCVLSCLAPQDCITPGASAALDADNYNCTAGACEYRGCNNNAECQSTFSSSTYICNP